VAERVVADDRAAVAGGVVFATGAVDPAPRYVLAVGAMVIGNAMTVASLSSHRIRQLRRDRWSRGGGVACPGATPRRATVELNRAAVHDAMIPSVDQTKTTGVVVLPGAFVGALFGGLSPSRRGGSNSLFSPRSTAGAITAVTTVFLASGNRVLAPR
jgi:putative ABC transport system permease protein